MSRNWQSQPWGVSVFQSRKNLSDPIPSQQIIDLHCPFCQYHTAWQRSKTQINCGWCFEDLSGLGVGDGN
jgi:ribosomal protein L37AE/L43A